MTLSQMSRLPTPDSNAAYTTKCAINPTETHAAVLALLYNLNYSPGLLLEVRGKLKAHSGGFLVFLLWIFTCAGKFPRGKVDPIDKSVLHAALREAKEGVGIDVCRTKILGWLGPPTRSLSGLTIWPYMMNFKCCGRTFPPNNLGEGVSARETVRIIPRRRRHIAVTFACLVIPDIIPSRGHCCLPYLSLVSQTLVISESTGFANLPRIGREALQTLSCLGSNGPMQVQTPRADLQMEDSVDS